MTPVAVALVEQARWICRAGIRTPGERSATFCSYLSARIDGLPLTAEETHVLSLCLEWLLTSDEEPEALRHYRRPSIAEAARSYALRSVSADCQDERGAR